LLPFTAALQVFVDGLAEARPDRGDGRFVQVYREVIVVRDVLDEEVLYLLFRVQIDDEVAGSVVRGDRYPGPWVAGSMSTSIPFAGMRGVACGVAR